MTGDGPADQDIVLFGKYFDDLQALHLHAVAAHPARHADAFHDAGGIGGVTQRARGALTVVLAVRLRANAMEPVTLDDALETLSFRRADDFDLIAFGKDIDGDRFTQVLGYGIIAEFFYKLLGGGA